MLELGAGATGLPGLVAARLLGSPLVLTDLPEQLAALQRSAALNGVAARAEAYAWGEATELRGGLVLAADVLYDTEAVEPLVEALEKVSEPWSLCLVAFDTALGRWGAYNTFLDIIEGRWTVALWRPFEGSRSGCRRGFEAFRVIFRLSRDVLRPSKELLAEKMQLEGFRKPSVQVYCLSERAFLGFQGRFRGSGWYRERRRQLGAPENDQKRPFHDVSSGFSAVFEPTRGSVYAIRPLAKPG